MNQFKMLLIQVLILTLLSLSNCNCLSVEKERELIPLFDSYVQIKNYLSDNVNSDDSEESMREVRRWLDEKVSKSSDQMLIKALELFTSMDNGEPKCTIKSMEILDSNDYLTHRQARYIGKKWVVPTKIIEMIAHFTKKQAQECYEIYSQKLKVKYEGIGKDVTERVDALAYELHWYPDQDAFFMYMSEHGEAAYEAIKKLSVNDPDKIFLKRVRFANGEMNLDVVKLRGLFNRYLLEPCEQFVTLDTDGLYESLSYYRTWITPDDKLLQKYPYRHSVCQNLLEQDSDRTLGLLRNVARNK